MSGARQWHSWLRSPRHIGVKRALSALGELRGAKVPPSNWDDLTRQDILDRSWKRGRRTQHRGNT